MLRERELLPPTILSDRRFFSLALLIIIATAFSSGGNLVSGRSSPRPAAPAYASSRVSPAPAEQIKTIIGTFLRNENITQALVKNGLSRDMVLELVQTTRPVYNLGKVKADQKYFLNFTPEGEFVDFRYIVDEESYLTVWREEGRFVPRIKKFQFETRIEPVTGVIEDSLFATIANTGEKDKLAEELAGLFQWDIDFSTDIQKGDCFRVLVEKKYLNGQFVNYGPKPILAADLVASKKVLSGFRFKDETGAPAYFAPDGKSLKKSFLKSPLSFVRISSKFTSSRFHPILKLFRPHLGVDYAAPSGTPVRAVAAGMVELAGWNGEGGKCVKLRHSGGYQTSYMHLSKIAVRPGARVSQGDLVGCVGATGLATGPHLDFRVLLHGKPMNPAKVVLPPAPPVAQSAMQSFASVRDALRGQLDKIVF
jgi:murein DD-endopeptidase MepM/ murein hydrolase activator NlpD